MGSQRHQNGPADRKDKNSTGQKKYFEEKKFTGQKKVMPKYWGKQIFAHGRFPEVGQKQKTERKRRREKEEERLNMENRSKISFFL